MKQFEDFGRWLEEEIQHVKHLVETEIRPAAEKNFISALRAASGKLAEMAAELEKRAPRPGA
ncbi:MAG TPA: hypothetical protein VKR82_11875 [Candidatus Acidoferrales bacterium]|nr:hypothetical protein [Candidatus Acidoferrales bacterium]